MRLFLLPVSTRRSLIYCERVAQEASPGSRTLADRITHKANETWANWENAESGWKKQLTTYGNKMLTRIPFEEWGLKTLPPLSDKRRAAKEQVDVLFPGLFVKESRVLETLHKLATERQGLHRSRLWWSFVGMPITIPFALVPIVPNIPFFYLVFRAWSHYRALYGSKHLEYLLQQKLINTKPSPILDEMYAAVLIHPTRQQSRDAPAPTQEQIEEVAKQVEQKSNGGEEETMVLQRWNGKLLAERFKIPAMEVEIERAVEQVQKSLKAKKELNEEKRDIEKAAASRPKDRAKM